MYTKYSIAVVDLIPEMVYVCPGGQLNLTCKSNATLIRWNVTVPQYQRAWTRSLSYMAQLGAHYRYR